jgi:hypothetical protein
MYIDINTPPLGYYFIEHITKLVYYTPQLDGL